MKNPFIYGGVLVVGVIFLSVGGLGRNSKFETLTLHSGDFLQQISVSGKVVAAEKIDLAFEEAGRVSSVYVSVGSRVNAYQSLIALDNSELSLELAKAEATLEVAKTELSKASLAPDDAKANLIDKIKDAYTKADDAVRNKADQIFKNPRSGSPELPLLSIDTAVAGRVIAGRIKIEGEVFYPWGVSLNSLNFSSDLNSYAKKAKDNLDAVRIFLDDLALLINNPNALLISGGGTQAIPETWRTDVSSARTNISTALNNVTLASEKLTGSYSDIATRGAKLIEAEANVNFARARLSKTILRAPISGIISREDARVGSTVGANESIISLLSAGNLEIESYVPEKNAPLLEIKDEAGITLDAYGDSVIFKAEIVSIEPAETVRDGVSTYKIKLRFLEQDSRVRPGMTANVLITTEKKSGVISVPQGIIIEKDGFKFVKVKEGEKIIEREVKIGASSLLGGTEILSGLSDGDVVILELSE